MVFHEHIGHNFGIVNLEDWHNIQMDLNKCFQLEELELLLLWLLEEEVVELQLWLGYKFHKFEGIF